MSSEGVGALLVDNCGGLRLVLGPRWPAARPAAHLCVQLIAFLRLAGGIAVVVVVVVPLSFLQFAVAAVLLFRNNTEVPGLEPMDVAIPGNRKGNMPRTGA
jgi:hypothetical protein